ncbi:MAG TPA: 1-(5-phosphoribosyl)-5-[(5-phosphoribosylamino)methylideneamino] imidazole-4-carboxamide isomerase [Bryobacteraceae bacterium]|jgi:phosphoribosylformimino-5-aminoimidazole carboxamide ribotide isomerase|nr:1-(5-phosphoribosyl)-5-[(5-phosphoribosylamino)methylideneamino] imidazole-4-carboxamide isomerase [Bryobacteraceae bacterium]
MVIPCIDLQGGKVVQLVQGREKALEGEAPLEMLRRFQSFPQVQVIDLDAATGAGSNDGIVGTLAAQATVRVGGGVRTPERAARLVSQGAHRVIVGTAAFDPALLREISAAAGRERLIVALDSFAGKVVVKGWREETPYRAEDVIPDMEPYCGGFLCTYVDREGMMQGTDLNWFRRLRNVTALEISAAGGITTMDEIRELSSLKIHPVVGMAIYTGRLDLEELAAIS